MNEEKNKKILLIIFISLILGGTIWAIISLTYSPIKELRSNNNTETNSYKDVTSNNTTYDNDNNTVNSTDENILSNIDITADQSIEGSDTSNISSLNTETEIAKYTTTIYDTEASRIHNIKLAIDKLDNTIVEANEEFSFNNTIGPMGAKQGYQKATGFDGNGKKIKIYGGGMCQISSTLYNATLIAKLKITERHPHSRRVYYVPQNKDASVAYGGADFKFKNTSGKKIKIKASTDGHDVTVTLYTIG